MSRKTCGYAPSGTWGHECGKPALFAGSRTSDKTVSGIYWASRCRDCIDLTGRDNQGIRYWEPIDHEKHRNEWK